MPKAPQDLSAPASTSLYARPFIPVYAAALLGFSINAGLQPVIPLYVLALGGDATVVGIVALLFSLPSVALRPAVGRLADAWGAGRVLLVGSVGIGLAGLGYLLPSLPALLVNRIIHGIAHAVFSTGAHAALAAIAPVDRRAEASTVFNLMPAIATMLMPGAALLIVSAVGVAGSFVTAAFLGLLAASVVAASRVRVHRVGASIHPDAVGFGDFVAKGSILPMMLEAFFTSIAPLFLVYPPVFAATRGITLGELAVYYLIYGAALVGTRLVAPMFLDRYSRRGVIACGALLSTISLVMAAQATGITGLTLAGALQATAAGFASPTIMAAAIDRADPGRLGAAMATYTVGYPTAIGIGAAVWGIMIDAFGYPVPYYSGIATQVAVLFLVLKLTDRRGNTARK